MPRVGEIRPSSKGWFKKDWFATPYFMVVKKHVGICVRQG